MSNDQVKQNITALFKAGATLDFLIDIKPPITLPKHLLQERTCVLRLSPGDKDLLVTNLGISATLFFKGSPFWCCVRWSDVLRVDQVETTLDKFVASGKRASQPNLRRLKSGKIVPSYLRVVK